MNPEIYPGILTHTLEEYAARLEMVEESSSLWAHIDIADGQFVPTITVMPHEIMGIATKLKLEAHIMTFRPERYFSDLTVAGVHRVLLHREAYKSLDECSDALRHAGDYFQEVGLVINPDTPVENYKDIPAVVIQCMGVQPGSSGQPFLEEAIDQISQVKAQSLDKTLAVDGGVNEENIKDLQKAGVTRFVMSSHLFAEANIKPNLQYFIQLVSGGI